MVKVQFRFWLKSIGFPLVALVDADNLVFSQPNLSKHVLPFSGLTMNGWTTKNALMTIRTILQVFILPTFLCRVKGNIVKRLLHFIEI